jgi:predicted TPR repeat methyltransferase/protein involved in temperature-dependent protein secretion
MSIADILSLHKAGQLQEAKNGYLALLKTNPNDVSALHYLGLLYAEEGDLNAAQAQLEKALTFHPQDFSLQLHLANIYKGKGLFNEAIQLLINVIKSEPHMAAAYNNLGTLYFAQSKWQAALEAYQTAIQKQPDYLDAYYNLALTLTKLQRIPEAITVYQSLIDLAPKHPGARFQWGCLLMQQQEYQAAIEQFIQIEEEYPFHYETQTNLATCYLKLGGINQAKTHYLKALNMHPADIQILFNLGVISVQQGQINQAIEYYLRALNEDANQFEVHNNLGVAYLAVKDRQKALQHFQEALRIQPNNEAMQHLKNVLSLDKHITFSPPEYIQHLFDSYADHYDAHMKQTLKYQVPQSMYQLINQQKEFKNRLLDILDLGCGTGLCGELFKPLAHSLMGVDLSANMLAVANQKHIYNQLIQADNLAFLKQQRAAFDLIIAGDVLVYVGDLHELLIAVFEALREEGYFVFNVEKGETETFEMTVSGRFAHGKNYIEEVIKRIGFKKVASQSIHLRWQEDKAVEGYLYLLQR